MTDTPVQPIDDVLAAAVASGSVPGAVAVVGDRDRLLYLGAHGYADPERLEPLRPDTIFRLASMTKRITTVGLMRLVDAGRLGLDDPVASHLPEFDELPVMEVSGGRCRRQRRPHPGYCTAAHWTR